MHSFHAQAMRCYYKGGVTSASWGLSSVPLAVPLAALQRKKCLLNKHTRRLAAARRLAAVQSLLLVDAIRLAPGPAKSYLCLLHNPLR
jgi:hypothetical protein